MHVMLILILRDILEQSSHKRASVLFAVQAIHSLVVADDIERMFHPTQSNIQAIPLTHKSQGGSHGEVKYDNVRLPALKGVDGLNLHEP